MTAFWIALQFLTVLPVQLKQMPSAQQNAQSVLFYPFIGLGIGLLLCGIAMLLLKLPVVLLSTLILVLWIWFTGGLHLDGLADTADAWVGGYGDPERTLKIMKDPSSGPIGVLSLIIFLALKFAALYVVLEQQQWWLLVITPMLARLAPLLLFLTTPYLRKKGLGSGMVEHLPHKASYVVLMMSLLVCIWAHTWGMLCAMIGLISIFYLRSRFIKRIKGITGDTVGASIEMTESITLFSMISILSLL